MPIGDTWKRRRWNAIRYDPWQKKEKKNIKSKTTEIITPEGSSRGTISSSSSSDGIEFLSLFRLLPDIYLCFRLCLTLFVVSSTFIFSFIGLRVLYFSSACVAVVGISLSLYLAYLVNFLFPLLSRFTLYIDGIVPIWQCNLCSLLFK